LYYANYYKYNTVDQPLPQEKRKKEEKSHALRPRTGAP
jgi:hypothetical protein